MEITEVRIKLMDDSDDRLQAFCSVTLDDCFVIRDLKIIDGSNGPFVAMPSRKLTSHCPQCGCKNHLRSAYCNQCGARLKEDRAIRDADGRTKLYADIAHPINSKCREMIQERVIAAFRVEVEQSKQPGYRSRYDEAYGDEVPIIDAGPEDTGPMRPPKTKAIQPAGSEPRPPHMSKSGDRPAESAPRRKGGDDFGAGIL
ncbi:MAG: stage V sporulation protein G [Planctomycetes bacterium]|nr:stage V sporulation protein G [Planctomycetota bacterium]